MALTTINSDGVKDDSIVNADIKSDAAIAGSKIAPDFGSQNIVTTGTIGIGASPTTGKLEINAGSSGTDVTVLRLDSSAGGAFNIQCSDASSATPVWKFDLGISEPLQIDSAATTRFLSGSGDSSIAIGKTGAANDAVVVKYDESGDKLHFYGWGGSEGDILTLDNGNSRVGIGTDSPGNPLHVKSTTTDLLKLDCNDAGALGAHLQLNHDSSSPADDDVVGAIEFAGKDSSGNGTIYSRIRGVALDVTDGTEDGALVFGTRVDASFGERMRINGTNVGIGTSSPGQKLSVNGAIDATDYRVLADNANASFYLTTPSDFRFRTTSGTERARILSTGGLTFNGDTASANALDDYEEGTWTPTYLAASTAPTLTSHLTTGYYTKVGNLVTVTHYTGSFTLSGSPSGTPYIGGLPFAAKSTGNNYATNSFTHTTCFTTAAGGYVSNGGSTIAVIQHGDNTSGSAWKNSGTQYLMIHFTYLAA